MSQRNGLKWFLKGSSEAHFPQVGIILYGVHVKFVINLI